MNGYKIQSSVKKLIIIFIIICIAIVFISQFLFSSVTSLYEASVQGRLEERAQQYKNSFIFKMNYDCQTLRTMANTLENIPDTNLNAFLINLWDIAKNSDFVCLSYISQDGTGIEITSENEIFDIVIDNETPEMQYAIKQAFAGNTYYSHAFYDPVLGYNTIGYATPVYTDKSVSGVLICSVDTETYADILSDVATISNIGAVAVISNEGEVLASTRTHQTKGFYEVGNSDYLNVELRNEFVTALSADQAQFIKFQLYDRPLYAYIMPMEVYSDKIIIVDSDSGINDAASGMLHYARISGALFCAVSILFAVAVLYLNRRHSMQLLNIAYHDRLTGAYNRYRFLQLLDENWKNDTEYLITSMNIRNFKYINELFTPANCDKLLKDICFVLNKHMQTGEFFCRDTADTFVIAFKNLDEDIVRARLEQIFSDITHHCKGIPSSYPILFYCGCAFTTDCSDKNSKEELMSHVMLAVNYAKQSNQSNICFYDYHIHDKENLKNYIESRMSSALKNEEFKLFLQPKIDLNKNILSGAEALVRWVAEGNKVIFPNEFIPIFESNGFCIELDYYMVEQVCKQIRSWVDDGITPVPISVNQTKLLFYEDDYVERICDITKRYNVPSKYIVLEILEGLALDDPDKVSYCINRLHSYGFRISMDDFGTGYSSLNTLIQLPIDELKLDRSFLQPTQQNTENSRRKILKAIIDVTKRLDISTVAEGIETDQQVSLMKEFHCDYGQGYYYSKPISVSEFTNNFLNNKKTINSQ